MKVFLNQDIVSYFYYHMGKLPQILLQLNDLLD